MKKSLHELKLVTPVIDLLDARKIVGGYLDDGLEHGDSFAGEDFTYHPEDDSYWFDDPIIITPDQDNDDSEDTGGFGEGDEENDPYGFGEGEDNEGGYEGWGDDDGRGDDDNRDSDREDNDNQNDGKGKEGDKGGGQGDDNDDDTDDGPIDKGNSNQGGENSGYKIEDATKYLREHASEKSKGECAKAVRLALEAGGLDTSGRPNAAADYNNGFLQSLGFIEVSLENYTPQAGDIVVHERQEGHPWGHIAMYDGSVWISDFIQRDMFGGSAYRDNPDYSIWRK